MNRLAFVPFLKIFSVNLYGISEVCGWTPRHSQQGLHKGQMTLSWSYFQVLSTVHPLSETSQFYNFGKELQALSDIHLESIQYQ